jgi:hypothetical protein
LIEAREVEAQESPWNLVLFDTAFSHLAPTSRRRPCMLVECGQSIPDAPAH